MIRSHFITGIRHMKKILLALSFLALASCNDVSKTGADGYKFGEPSFEKRQVDIELITYDNRAAFLEAGKKLGVNDPDLMAFAQIPVDSNDNTCTVHVLSPKTSYEPEWYGHEFMHCYYGQWHTSNEDRQ